MTSNNLKDITGDPSARPAPPSRRGSRPTTGTSATSTSTTTATPCSTSTPSGRRWTGSSSATGPTATPTPGGRPRGDPVRHQPDRAGRPAARRHRMSPHLTRRTLVTTSAARSSPPRCAERVRRRGRGRKRAYVLVVDGCKPDEIDATLTPTLAALRAGGLNHPRARSLPIMETIPNHVMMMSGLRPDRTGVPANVDLRPGARRDPHPRPAARPRAADRLERLDRAGFTTGDGAEQGVPRRDLRQAGDLPLGAGRLHPDLRPRARRATMDATLAMVEEHDPNLVFVNLGDVDRVGHTDFTGALDARLARQTALGSTDTQVARLVDQLQASGAWEHSMVVVLADHSMDWSAPDDSSASVRPSRPTRSSPARSRSPRTAVPSCSTGWRRTRQRDEAIERMGGRGERSTAYSTPTPGPAASCGSGPRPATWCSTARPGGGSPRTPSRTRSPATTATRPPGRSRSSSPAATPPYPERDVVAAGADRRRRAHGVATFFGVGAARRAGTTGSARL